jgi:hypothetical protein
MERFYYNLEKYKPYEIEASRRIKIKYNIDIKSFCDNNKYDFITTDDIKYEVKTDEASKKTNNFFIEFSGYNKPSGITTTESNYYILSNTIDYYLIETSKLKELIQNNTFKIVKVKTNDTYGYLINKNIIISNSIII